MKELLIKLVTIILSFLQLSICNDKILKFTLSEAKSNELTKNTELNVYYYQIVCDGPPNLDFIKKVKTNDRGEFDLPQSIFGEKQIAIEWGEEPSMISFGIHNDSLVLRRNQYGFSQVLGLTCYNLKTGIEGYYDCKENKTTATSKFDFIKLTYEAVDYRMLWDRRLVENKIKFQSNQAEMWENMWDDFQKAVEYQAKPPLNISAWGTYMMISERVIDFDLKTAFDVTMKIKDENKRYYFLYTLCWIAVRENNDNKKVDKQIIQWIDNEVHKYYRKRKDLSLSVKPKSWQTNEFGSMYAAMKYRFRN